jgi:hypothetical protein
MPVLRHRMHPVSIPYPSRIHPVSIPYPSLVLMLHVAIGAV